MTDNEENLKLLDLIDINFLQEFQDIFSNVMGVASLIYDTQHPITTPSNFSGFCRNTRSSDLGQTKCQNCDLFWGKVAAEKKEPVIYACHTGLTDFVVPIIVEGMHLGSFYAGQILTEAPDEEHFRRIARMLSLDEEKYIEEVRKLRIIPKKKIEETAKLLSLVANAISKIAHKNYELRRKNSRELLYKRITETIRSSLDIDETKAKIVEVVGKTLDADRCFIVEYDKELDKFLVVKDEYLSSKDLTSFKGADANAEIPIFAEALKAGKTLIINNKQIFLDSEIQTFEKESEAIKRLSVNSAFGFPLFFHEEFLGVLSIHYVREGKIISQDEINLITVLANQIALAIYHAKLYKKMSLSAQKETLIANIMAKSLSSFGEGQFKQLVTDVGQLMNADRCFFVELEENEMRGNVVPPENEYLASDDIKSLGEFGFATSDVSIFLKDFLKNKDVVVYDYEKLRSEFGEDADYNKYSKKFDLKSGIAVTFFYEDKLNAVLAIEYVKEKYIPSSDELNFLRILGNHVGLIYNQNLLYKQSREIAERETILRKIIEVTRSSLDIKEVKKNVLKLLCEELRADRCIFRAYDKVNDRALAPDSEYLTTSNVKSISNLDLDQEAFKYFVNQAKEQKRIFHPIVLNEENVKGTITEKYFKDLGMKADYAIPITDIKDELVWLALHYVDRDPKLDENYIKMLESIGYQIDIAFTQIKLYEQVQKEVSREALLRQIYEDMRSSLDLSDIKNKIVEKIGRSLEADLCFILQKREDNDEFYIDNFAEYRSSPEIKGRLGFDLTDRKVKWFMDAFRRGEESSFTNAEDFIASNNLQGSPEEGFLNEYGIKSMYHIPVVYANKLKGYIIVDYITKYKILDKDDLEMLARIATQAGIAMHQAEMYAITQSQSERERILRKIIEVTRSSMDIKEVKYNVLKELCSELKADRCFFRNYDKKAGIVRAPEIEYLSSPDVKSLLNNEPAQEAVKYFLDAAQKQKRLFYPTVVTSDMAVETETSPYFAQNDIKADYAIPITNIKDELTWLVLHYTKENPNLSEDYKKLLETIGYHVDIAITQIKLYEEAQKEAERESLLRQIFESLRSSLDINKIKNKIVTEVGKALGADVCFMFLKGDCENCFYNDEYCEYRASEEESSRLGTNLTSPGAGWFSDAFNRGEDVLFANASEFLKKNNLQDSLVEGLLKRYNIKSGYHLPIYYANTLLGYLILNYTKSYRDLSEDELSFLSTIATQAGIALHQAKLYKIMQDQAEREKISRNIIEIVRSTLEKSLMKHLFVKNIGEYFKADRVLFSEYNEDSKMYEPVEEGSEYLSSPKEKSFVGYDWSQPSCFEYIMPLLEKKELNIYNWEKYIEKNPKSQDFISLFEDSDVKSSYNLPVMYQQRIMGYFCIEFTQRYYEMPDEDINLIRSICRQAGIALYQTELLEKAKCKTSESSQLTHDILEKIKNSLNSILEFSDILSKIDDEREKQNEYINQINILSRNLVEIINEINL